MSQLSATRRLGRIVPWMIAAAALLAGPAWAIQVERAPAPEGSWSLGAAGVYVEIRDLGGRSHNVSIPMSESEVRWLDQALCACSGGTRARSVSSWSTAPATIP